MTKTRGQVDSTFLLLCCLKKFSYRDIALLHTSIEHLHGSRVRSTKAPSANTRNMVANLCAVTVGLKLPVACFSFTVL